jgi:hypothetical protein
MKKIFFIMFIGLSLIVYICALAEETDAPKTGTIKGKVTDIETPRPNNVPGATVIVESETLLGDEVMTTMTDDEGNYEIRNLPPGEYVVKASKEGYGDSMDHATVTVVAGSESFHDIRLVETITMKDPLDRGGAFWGLLVLCVIVVFIYAIRRRSSGGKQDG